MTRLLFSAALLLAIATQGSIAVLADESRTWTDVTGTYKMEAEFMALKDGQVQLRKTNGTIVNIPLQKFSKPDQEYAQSKAAGAMSPNRKIEAPAWLQIPERELSCKLSVIVGLPRDPNANRMLKSSISLAASGALSRQKGRSYTAEGEGRICLWTTTDTADKGKHFPFSYPLELLENKELPAIAEFKGFKNLTLSTNDDRVIAFRDTRVLACYSNTLVFDDGTNKRRFVAVTYDYELTDSAHDIGQDKFIFTNKKNAFWPLDEEFLRATEQRCKEGEPFHEAASHLLLDLEQNAEKKGPRRIGVRP
jgi:hypothetical protein